MSVFDFTSFPDYSIEDYPPGGIANDLHFVSRFLVTFEPQNRSGLIDLVALTHYTHLQHSTLDAEYSISAQMKPDQILYGFWAGFDQDGEFVISSSGSESFNIQPDKELEKNFLSNKEVKEKLELLMPHIKVLGSVVFKRF